MLLAHGVGTRGDLPVPVWLAAGGAGLAVLISFGALTLLWRKPLLGGAAAGWPIPHPVASVLDSAAVRGALRGLATLITVGVCLIGLFGPANAQRNLTPWAFYVTFWVGIVPASLLLGPVWRILNPLRLVHAALSRLLRLDPRQGVLALPQRLGYWPAAASLAAFAALELVVPGRSQPDVVAWFVLVYAVVHIAAALVFGQRWFERGDGFEVYSTLLGTLAPLGRRRDGRIVLRSPLDGLKTIEPAPGLVAVMVTLVGSTAYDGLSRTSFWNSVIPSGPTTATLGLACCILLIAAVYLLGTWRVVIPGQRDAPTPTTFAPTIVPTIVPRLCHRPLLFPADFRWSTNPDPGQRPPRPRNRFLRHRPPPHQLHPGQHHSDRVGANPRDRDWSPTRHGQRARPSDANAPRRHRHTNPIPAACRHGHTHHRRSHLGLRTMIRPATPPLGRLMPSKVRILPATAQTDARLSAASQHDVGSAVCLEGAAECFDRRAQRSRNGAEMLGFETLVIAERRRLSHPFVGAQDAFPAVGSRLDRAERLVVGERVDVAAVVGVRAHEAAHPVRARGRRLRTRPRRPRLAHGSTRTGRLCRPHAARGPLWPCPAQDRSNATRPRR
jgi:hypothetical protein